MIAPALALIVSGDMHVDVEQFLSAQVITAKGQSFNAAYLLPGSTSVVDMKAHSVGDWMYQCGVQARNSIALAAYEVLQLCKPSACSGDMCIFVCSFLQASAAPPLRRSKTVTDVQSCETC